jgi:hypothetical protein
MANDDSVQGGWEMLVGGGHGQVGRTVRLAGPPPESGVENWAQRPTYRGPLVRVKVLRSEVSHFENFQAGDVLDVPDELAKPRIRDGRMRLARPDEKLTTLAIE